MEISYKHVQHNIIDYYLLPNGHADVFLHKNMTTETGEEGNTQYAAEEVYFQVDSSITKEDILQNFEYWWNFGQETPIVKPTNEERLQALEYAMLELILGGFDDD